MNQLSEAFREALKVTKSGTATDGLLRGAVIKKTISNFRFYLGGKCPEFNELAKAEPAFSFKMLLSLAKSKENKGRPRRRDMSPPSPSPELEDQQWYLCNPAQSRGSSKQHRLMLVGQTSITVTIVPIAMRALLLALTRGGSGTHASPLQQQR